MDYISRQHRVCDACAVARRQAEDGGGGVCEEVLLRVRDPTEARAAVSGG